MKNLRIKFNIMLGMIILVIFPLGLFIFMALAGDNDLNKSLSLAGAAYLIFAFIITLFMASSVDKSIVSVKEQIKSLITSISMGKLDKRADANEAGCRLQRTD